MKQFLQKPFVKGTLILTLSGCISRIIGFLYRMYLSHTFGEENMGIYQLLFPILSLSFSLCCGGYQTAISKLVAERSTQEKNQISYPFFAALLCSIPCSLILSALIIHYRFAISLHFLKEIRCANLLPIMALSIPLSTLHACFNGYFYGKQKAFVPASTQLIEQTTRVLFVICLTQLIPTPNNGSSLQIVVAGLAIGELFAIISSHLFYRSSPTKATIANNTRCYFYQTLPTEIQKLFSLSLPLSANRVSLNIMQSIEAVSIPIMLCKYGYTKSEALSIYGVLTGMVLPLILFPNALTSSLSVMLLPSISIENAKGNKQRILKKTWQTTSFSLVMGILCFLIFFLSCKPLGLYLFHSPLAGNILLRLCFLCPMLYLSTTLSGILHGLGLATPLFFINIMGLFIRLGFVFLYIPKYGISAYILGMIISHLLLCLSYLFIWNRHLSNLPEQ